jgi:nitrogen fixation NifU-like protein
MSELMDLYQEVILDHNKKPRNRGTLDDADHEAKGDNPLCGDQLTLYIKMDGDRVTEIRFEGRGCAISVASASLMTEAITGKSQGEIGALYESFHELLTGDPSVAAEAGRACESSPSASSARRWPGTP